MPNKPPEIACASCPGGASLSMSQIARTLLSGGVCAQSRALGIPTESVYFVLALALNDRTSMPRRARSAVDPTDRIARLQTSLDAHFEHPVPTIIGARGGTVLIPAQADTDQRITTLAPALGFSMTDTLITITAIEASSEDLPHAAGFAHELLELALRLGKPPRLYRFGDLALEYQLTRPGPARRHLANMLEPLHPFPDLIQTLRVHLGNGLNRRDTARSLHIHANTIDYRMKRICQLTGLDEIGTPDIWRLYTAYVAHLYEHRDDSTPAARSTVSGA
ncbi:PucR family transcriptional regulator [Nocardia sp. NPDC056100]|uniref:PucR family transcriptional regulator n=1 Tax=Nocardia sp. NPDC056100 TaxID=3345712 RepID=UPI0035DFCB67